MDSNTSPIITATTQSFIPPAQLWVGAQDTLADLAVDYVQQQLCKQHCKTCVQCTKIRQQQHHNVLWLSPEKQYTLETLEPLRKVIMFERAANDPYFFILQKADCLPTASANSMLKTLEEPPTGYHFILLANCLDDVIVTIRSRCLITVHQQSNQTTAHQDIFAFFTAVHPYDPQAFAQVIDKSLIHEYDSMLLLDALLQHWTTTYRKALEAGDKKNTRTSQRIIHMIIKTAERPPMSGSAKLFWKNFFLKFQS